MTLTIPVPYPLWYETGVYAELHGMTREAVIQLGVRQLLDTDPRCAEVALAEQAAKRDARAAVLARYMDTP